MLTKHPDVEPIRLALDTPLHAVSPKSQRACCHVFVPDLSGLIGEQSPSVVDADAHERNRAGPGVPQLRRLHDDCRGTEQPIGKVKSTEDPLDLQQRRPRLDLPGWN
ncbi:MAG: hypothetical protein ACK559_23230, partial [bacterium]